jgi:hypothetical protein
MQVLKCPGCGGLNLHHTEVTVFARQREDGNALRVDVLCGREFSDVGDGGTALTTFVNDAPGRRDSLEIHFRCEGCEEEPVLCIVQHKGWTMLSWRGIKNDVEISNE